MLQKERLVVSRLGNDICAVECDRLWLLNSCDDDDDDDD